ncbi:MAG: hypothetical protein AABN95_21915 [Acidobacteriota bacterium]
MKKTLTLALALVALTVLTSFSLAQERREIKIEPALQVESRSPSLLCCGRGRVSQLNLSTGQGGPIDPLWKVNGGAAYITPPYPGWATNLGPAKWIQPVAAPTPSANVAVGIVKYTVQFNVPKCGIPSEVRLDGTFAADNGANVTFDGNPVTSCPTPYCFKTPGQPLTVTGILAGTHTLTFEVKNEGGPSGLSVNAKLTRKCLTANPTNYTTKAECEDHEKQECMEYAGAGWHVKTCD